MQNLHGFSAENRQHRSLSQSFTKSTATRLAGGFRQRLVPRPQTRRDAGGRTEMKYTVLFRVEVEASDEDEAIDAALEVVNTAVEDCTVDDIVDEVSELP